MSTNRSSVRISEDNIVLYLHPKGDTEHEMNWIQEGVFEPIKEKSTEKALDKLYDVEVKLPGNTFDITASGIRCTLRNKAKSEELMNKIWQMLSKVKFADLFKAYGSHTSETDKAWREVLCRRYAIPYYCFDVQNGKIGFRVDWDRLPYNIQLIKETNLLDVFREGKLYITDQLDKRVSEDSVDKYIRAYVAPEEDKDMFFIDCLRAVYKLNYLFGCDIQYGYHKKIQVHEIDISKTDWSYLGMRYRPIQSIPYDLVLYPADGVNDMMHDFLMHFRDGGDRKYKPMRVYYISKYNRRYFPYHKPFEWRMIDD